ncbi:MAG: hypothetical protein JST04_02280 [Bdellovibrionales bacterium]|nr:hypothetical protein [Bdellovibrionales bacterium]
MRSSLRPLLVSIVILAAASVGASSARAAASGRPLGNATRATYPSVVSIELLGRSMLYSVNFDQALNENMSAGFGLGSSSMNIHNTDLDANKSATFLPAYFDYYFLNAAGSPYVTAGVTLILNHSSVKGTDTSTGNLEIPSSPVMPTVGGGYEYRSDTGFLFRVAGYLVAGRSLTPWLGFSFGYAF